MIQTKREVIFFVLAGLFITNAVTAELISCKIVDIGLFPVIAGILPWPVVFLVTDILNEYYGKKTVRTLSFITVGLISFTAIIVNGAIHLPAVSASPVSDAEFQKVFGNSVMVILGSITAFLISQLIDIWSFWFMRRITGGKMIWLRATGSTVISQLFDSYIVLMIGFLLPGTISFEQFLQFGITGYLTKLVIAICLTPLIYGIHFLIDKMLGEGNAHKLIEQTANKSLGDE